MESINELVKLLGEENAEQLKKNIVNIITERVNGDLESFDEYLMCPDDMQIFINEIYEECKEEIKPILKERIFANALKKLEK